MDHAAPWRTADLPGIGGRIREKTEDFVVEEVPLYEPAGVGEHLYLTVRKVGLSTHEAVRRLAGAFGVPPGHVGYAGLKDARAVAIQRFSIHGAREEDAAGLTMSGLEVIDARLHRNKLRLGHLVGNRFLIRIRGVAEGADAAARAVLERLTASGVPNRFGPQRFGSKGDGHLVGRALIRGDADTAVATLLGAGPVVEADERLREARRRWLDGDAEGALRAFPPSYRAEHAVLSELARGASPARAVRRIPKPVYKLLVSAYQSWLFNRLLDERMPDLGRLETGDLAFLHGRGAVFRVEDLAAEQPRADVFEISPSGPLFGRKVTLADGEPGRRERAILAAEEITVDHFRGPAGKFDGARRPFRVPLGEARVRADGEGAVLLGFSLPKGSFATAVLREVQKAAETPTPEED